MPDMIIEPLVLAPANIVPRSAVSFGSAGSAATAVDEGHPLPIASGAPSTTLTSIAALSMLTPAIDLGSHRLHHIMLPAIWTEAAISFQCSADGVAWADLFDSSGEVSLPATVAGTGRAIVVDPAIFYGVRHLRIRSGLAAMPVSQSASRALLLMTVAR